MKKLNGNHEGLIFKYYNLTDLMLLKKNGRKQYKKILENSALYQLLYLKLEEYGLSLFGMFERDNMQFRGIRLLQNFPVENEEIIKQLYGYENFTTHVQLNGFDDFATSFDYNTTTGECELQRHSWQSVTNRVKYNSLKSMLKTIGDRTEETYKEIFNKV